MWKSVAPVAAAIATHTNNMRIMIGMSGGVDSSVAALLLKQSGAEVIGTTLLLTENDDGSNARDAKAVADALGISHTVCDMRKEFKQYVKDYFVREYKEGKTPNPCIVCNSTIKFGAMFAYAEKNDCDYLATGHYAKVLKNQTNGLYTLQKAACSEKDQTYFLYRLTQKQLAKTKMPLGDYTKSQVRALAESAGIAVFQKRDSQDICFIPDGDKNRYLRQFLPETCGIFVDIHGNVLGTHKGIFHYTIGQRKGLGMAFGKPMFVLSINAKDNTVVLGEAGQEFSEHFCITDCNFLPFAEVPDGFTCMCKVRFSASETPCRLEKTSDGYRVHLETPARAITPGQAAVFYVGDDLVGGGTIKVMH